MKGNRHCLTNLNNVFIGFWRPLALDNYRLRSYPLSLSLERLLPSSLESCSRCRLGGGGDLTLSSLRLSLSLHHHHHEINEEAETSTACPLLVCSAQQHAEAAITTALAQVEAACSIAHLQVGPRPLLHWPPNWIAQWSSTTVLRVEINSETIYVFAYCQTLVRAGNFRTCLRFGILLQGNMDGYLPPAILSTLRTAFFVA